MRKCSVLLVLVLASSMANAGGLLDTIRAVREVTDTAKEVNQARKDVQAVTNTQSPAVSEQAAQPSVSTQNGANSILQTGDVIVTKIKSVKLLKEANKKSAKVAVLAKASELVFGGKEEAGFYFVQSEKGDGWVDKLLVKKQ